MKHSRRKFLHLATGALALPAVSRGARAQSYPSRPITIVVGYAAGGPTDIVTTMAEQRDTTVPRPPYLILNHEHLVILFEAEESTLKASLPIGVKAAPGNVVGLNMYRTQEAVGLVPYTASYLWIDVDGFDSPDGTKGRWMVQGWYGPEPVPSAIRNYMGVPVQLGVTNYQRDGNLVHASLISDGVNLIDATITLTDGPIHKSGFLNYPALGRNLAQPAPSAFVVNRIPGVSEITPAAPVSMEFHFRETDAAKALQPKRLLNAFYIKGAASAFVVPEPAGK
jgi:acetoacetate decarboxylase